MLSYSSDYITLIFPTHTNFKKHFYPYVNGQTQLHIPDAAVSEGPLSLWPADVKPDCTQSPKFHWAFSLFTITSPSCPIHYYHIHTFQILLFYCTCVLLTHFHRITEWLRLVGTSGGHLVQHPCSSMDT